MWIVTRPGSIAVIVLIWRLSRAKPNVGASWFAVYLQGKRGLKCQGVVVESDFLTSMDSCACAVVSLLGASWIFDTHGVA